MDSDTKRNTSCRRNRDRFPNRATPGSIRGGFGSGWTIFNNEGNPVRQYEPFFSATHDFEFAATIGVSATLIYDPVGRVVATLNADHTFQKTMFDPWRQEIWDSNDTVLPDPGQDPDVGPLIGALPEEDYLPTWCQQREGGALGTAQAEAATKAAVHQGTPGLGFVDPLGRVFMSVEHTTASSAMMWQSRSFIRRARRSTSKATNGRSPTRLAGSSLLTNMMSAVAGSIRTTATQASGGW
jgi:hypothetical protein